MIYIALNILLSSLFLLLIRWLQHRPVDILTVGAVNYIVGAVGALLMYLPTGSRAYSVASCVFGAINGAAYFVSFFLLLSTMRWKGAALAAVLSRLSILVPVLCGILIWHERPSALQSVGIALACVSLTLVGRGRLTFRVGDLPWYAPIHMGAFFLIAGSSRLAQEAHSHMAGGHEEPSFLLALFGVAAIASAAMLLFRRKVPQPAELLYGAIIGLANVSQTFFILKALEGYAGYVVFPVVSAGGLVLTALVAAFLLDERLTRRSYVGIALAVLALTLLQANW